jgi:hypothetical protein
MASGSALIFFLVLGIELVSANCPRKCSGNGVCTKDLQCQCNIGFEGPDCSRRSCPKATPWFNTATSNDVARAEPVVCSAMGACDAVSGVCKCYSGFQGRACERMKCENDCSGNGRCVSMREAASTQDDKSLFYTTTYTEWDADRIFGCVCDDGYTGYDCSENTCVRGADPLWPTSKVDEIQTFDCQATGGTFRFKFRDEVTGTIAYDATVQVVQTTLGKLKAINLTTVTVSGSSGPICDADSAEFRITFITDPGDVPTLAVVSNALTGTGVSIALDAGNSQAGTKTNEVCNNRGTCGQKSGICGCYAGFESSNRQGGTGNSGDCGYNSISLTACPGSTPCNGHGVCQGNPNFRCTCFDGWINGECSQRSCPYGRAWFDEATGPNTAHAHAECSNMGNCDRQSGKCKCAKGFTGQSCERLQCPIGGEDSLVCAGYGQCVSLREAAKRRVVDGAPVPLTYGLNFGSSSTWDADKIYGCLCDRYKYFKGGRGALNFDCSLKECGYGDNVKTAKTASSEVQVVTCIGTGGTFQLSFREQTTESIPFNAIDEGYVLPLAGVATITQGSAAVPIDTDLTGSLSQHDVIELHSYRTFRNYTISAISSSSITLTEPVGLRSGSSSVGKVVLSVKTALEKLSTVQNVDVSFSPLQSNVPQACAASSGVAMSITFRGMGGDMPMLVATTTGLTGSGKGITVFEKIKGNREDSLCSGGGLCDYETGMCDCFTGLTSSNGEGKEGTLGECGFRNIKAKGSFD